MSASTWDRRGALATVVLLLVAGCARSGQPSGSGCAPDRTGAVLCLQAHEQRPTAVLLAGSERQRGIEGSGCWPFPGGMGCHDTEVPEPDGYLELTQGTTVQVAGDADRVQASVGELVTRGGSRHLRYVQTLDLTGGRDVITVPAGEYVMDVYGDWSQGESTFYLGIRIVPASSP